MNRDRRAILSLVAAGRINAVEAERLIAVTSGAQDAFWIAAVLALGILASFHGAATAPHLLQTAIHAAAHTLHHIVTLLVQLIGGRP